MSIFNDFAKRLGTLQRGFLSSDQKRNNGNPNSGTTGINVKPSTLPGAAASPMMSYLSKQAMQGKPPSPNVQPGTQVNTQRQSAVGVGAAFAPALAVTSGQVNQPAQPQADHMADFQKLLTQYEAIINSPWQYDHTADPSYNAAKQATDNAAKEAKDNTYADMADRGILNSSVTSSQLGQIETKSKEHLTSLIPGLEANAYSRHQQGISNQLGLLGEMMGQARWQAGYDQSNQFHQDDVRFRDAEIDGTYESKDYDSLMDQLIGAKQGWAGTTDANERTAFAQTGKDVRAALAAMTGRTPAEIDAMFGSGVGIDQATKNRGIGGVETMQAKQYREDGVRYADEQKYKRELDKKADDRWNKQFGADEAYRWSALKKSGSGGGGGGGMTATEMRMLMDNNTNGMIYQMSQEGVQTLDQALSWMKKNEREVMSGGINTGDIMDYFKDGGQTPNNGPKPKTPYEIHMDAVGLLEKDRGYSTEKDPAKKQAMLENLKRELEMINNPPKPLSPEDKAQMNLNHKVNWASRFQ